MKSRIPFRLSVALILSAILLSSCNTKKDNKCIIKGTVVNRDSDSLVLIKATDDYRSNRVYIPIIDNHFEYQMDVQDIEAYELAFWDEMELGSWRPITIFVEPGTIDLTLYPRDEYDKNIINGEATTKKYYEILKLKKKLFSPKLDPLYKEVQTLSDSGEYSSDKANLLFDRIRATENMDTLNVIYKELEKLRVSKEDISPKARIVIDKIDNINDKVTKWQYNYMADNPSIASYYLLVKDVLNNRRSKTAEELIVKTFPVFADKFPNHPYTSIVRDMIEGMESAKVGGKYIDFTAPDLEGNQVQIAKIIDNHKATFLDLWASWCGPCIAKSKAMIPVYNEYKDKGFTVLGVAREMKNTDAMKKAIERYGFPWLNLVELDDKNNIWKKYDIPFSGGRTFLIGEDGIIVAIDPSPDEVRKYMDKALK